VVRHCEDGKVAVGSKQHRDWGAAEHRGMYL
jgi:hypothetical protein